MERQDDHRHEAVAFGYQAAGDACSTGTTRACYSSVQEEPGRGLQDTDLVAFTTGIGRHQRRGIPDNEVPPFIYAGLTGYLRRNMNFKKYLKIPYCPNPHIGSFTPTGSDLRHILI